MLSFAAKLVVNYATKPEKICKVFIGFQAPNTVRTYFHSFQTTITLQSTFPPTIYQGLLILLLPKKVVRASILKI